MKYKTLLIAQVSYRIAGAILAILGSIGSLLLFSYSPPTAGFAALACVLGGLMLGATADLIQIFIDIERNTRAAAIKRLREK